MYVGFGFVVVYFVCVISLFVPPLSVMCVFWRCCLCSGCFVLFCVCPLRLGCDVFCFCWYVSSCVLFMVCLFVSRSFGAVFWFVCVEVCVCVCLCCMCCVLLLLLLCCVWVLCVVVVYVLHRVLIVVVICLSKHIITLLVLFKNCIGFGLYIV